jgi:hypothetical protein
LQEDEGETKRGNTDFSQRSDRAERKKEPWQETAEMDDEKVL